MKARYRVVYNRKGKLNKQGKALIQVEVYINRNEKPLIGTGIYIEPEFWDNEKKAVSYKHPSYLTHNKTIRDLIHELEEFEFELNRRGQRLSSRYLKENFRVQRDNQSLFHFGSNLINNDLSLSRNTIRNQILTPKYIEEFAPGLKFDEINQEFVDNWTNFLLKRVNKNSVTKHYKVLKKILKKASQRDLISPDRIAKLEFSIKYKSRRTVYLNYEELERILNISFPDRQIIELSRLAFLMACFTGLRISDALPLPKSALRSREPGIDIDISEMYKTEDPVYIPTYQLFDGAGQVIIKQLLSMSNDDWPLVMPKKLWDQDVNQSLKVVQSKAGIDKKITFHVGRHTFCTLLAFESKDPWTVMKYAGIRSIDTATQYIHVSKELNDEQLQKINWRKLL